MTIDELTRPGLARDDPREAMELSQLRAFVAVLDCGSVVHASKALDISRTTLQARISGLEDSLGIKLLVRTHRGVHPTEFGRRFTDQARALLRDADALTRVAERHREELIGQLYMRCSVGLPPQLLTLLARQIGQRHPELSLRLETTANPAADLPDDVDIVLHFAPAVPSGHFRTFTLRHFPEQLLASTAYLERHGRPASIDDLGSHRVMSWSPPGEDGRRLPLREGGHLAIEPEFISDDVYLLHCMAASGQGIALVPDDGQIRSLVPGDPREVVLGEVVGRDSALWALLPEAQADTPRCRAAVQLLREVGRGVFCLDEM